MQVDLIDLKKVIFNFLFALNLFLFVFEERPDFSKWP